MARGRGRGRLPLTPRKRGRPPKNKPQEREQESKIQGCLKKLSSGRKKLQTERIQQNANNLYPKLPNWSASLEKEFSPVFEKFQIQDDSAHPHTGYENCEGGHEATNTRLTQLVKTKNKEKTENIDKDLLETNNQALKVEYDMNSDSNKIKTLQAVANSPKHEMDSNMDINGFISKSKKLAPLKIHKSRFNPSCDEEDDDKTPEYPLAEDSTFYFNTHKSENDTDKSRNVFSAMYSTISYNGIASHTNSLNTTGAQVDIENDINMQGSRKLFNDGTKPKVQRIQMFPKLAVLSTQSSGYLAKDIVGSKDILTEDTIEEKQGDNIPRLSPVQDAGNANIKLPSQLINSQPPKLIRICSEKFSPVGRYEASSHVEEYTNDRYKDSIEQSILKKSINPLSSADKLAFTNQTEENNGVFCQVDETHIVSKGINSSKEKECLYQSNKIYSPDKTLAYAKSSLAQCLGSDSCSATTPQKQYSCHNESISDDELSPKPLMIDEPCQLDNNVVTSRSSCSETVSQPDGRDVETMHSGHSTEESVSVHVTENQSSTPHYQPIDSLSKWTGQTPPSQPQNSLSPTEKEISRSNLKGAVNKDSKDCNNQLGSWFTGFDHDNDYDMFSLVHSSDESISGCTAPQNLCYKDSLAKNINCEKEVKHTEDRTVQEDKKELEKKRALIIINKNIVVPDGGNGLTCLVNPHSDADKLGDHPLVHLQAPLDSRNNVHPKYVSRKIAQDIADMDSNTCLEPGRQVNLNDKQVFPYPTENHQTGNNLIVSHHEAYKSSRDNLIQTNERSRYTDRNQSNIHNEVSLSLTTAKEMHDPNIDLPDRRFNSSRVNSIPIDSYAHYYSREMSQANTSNIHNHKPNMISVSEGLSVCRDTQKTSFSSGSTKASAVGFNGLKEIRSYTTLNPHLNIECVQPDLLSPQHTFSLGPKQSFAPHNSGHKHFAPPLEHAHPSTQSNQYYPVTTYGQNISSILPGLQSSGHFHSYATAQRNYPAVTLQYLHNERMHAFPQTVNANMPLPANNYVHAASKPWPALDNSEQQTQFNSHSQREPYVSYNGRKDLMHSDRLLPQGQFCIQDGRPENLYHCRKAPSNCPVSMASVPSLIPASPYPHYQRSFDKSSTPRKIQQHQKNILGHHTAILAAQRGHEAAETSRGKEMVYPSWVRVPEISNNNTDLFAKLTNTENPNAKKMSKSDHETNFNRIADGTAHPSNQQRNITDIVMEPPAQKEGRKQEMVRKRHHRTAKDVCETNQSIIFEEPLDLSVNSRSCSQTQLSTSSPESSQGTSIRSYPEVGNRETQKSTSSSIEPNNQGSRPKDVVGSSNIFTNAHDKTSEKIGNYFKEASTVSEPDMMGNPLQFVGTAGSRDIHETRSSRTESSSQGLSVSVASTVNLPSNNSPLPVVAASPDIILLSPSGSTSTVHRISHSSSRASVESIETTPPKNIRIPLEKFQTSTPDKNSYAFLMINHITSKVKKTKELMTDELLGFLPSSFQSNLELFNKTLNNNIIDLTEAEDVVSISSGESDDEDREIENSKSSRSEHSIDKQSEPTQATYSHMDNSVILAQENVQISSQASNSSGYNSLKVNKAVRESMALKVKEAVSLHSMSNDLAGQAAAVAASNVTFPAQSGQASTSSTNKSKENPEPSAEQAAATLLMLSANPLYNNLEIIPQTSESYQEKVYQIQPLLGENETNTSQEMLTSRSQNATVRPGTKTGRRVGRPPKDEVWPQKNIEAVPVQNGPINTITNAFAGNFDTSLVHSTLTSLKMSQINIGNVDSTNSFPKPLTVQQMNHMPPFVENVHHYPSATVRRIDPKVAQLINFRLNKKNKEASEGAKKSEQNQTHPEMLPNRMCTTLGQPSTSSSLAPNLQDGIVKMKRKRRTKKEMEEAALLQSQNPHKRTRKKYRPRQNKKTDAVKQTVENGYVPFEKQILSSRPTESRPMVNELALTGCISPPATPDHSRKQAAPIENHYHTVKEQEKRLILDDAQETRQTNLDDLLNIEHFKRQHVITQAHNEDGLVVISLQPAQQLDRPLLEKDRTLTTSLDSRCDIFTKDLPSQGSGVCVDNLWLMSDTNSHRIDRTEEEEVIDWLSKNRKK